MIFYNNNNNNNNYYYYNYNNNYQQRRAETSCLVTAAEEEVTRWSTHIVGYKDIIHAADTNHSNSLLLAQHCHGNQHDWQHQLGPHYNDAVHTNIHSSPINHHQHSFIVITRNCLLKNILYNLPSHPDILILTLCQCCCCCRRLALVLSDNFLMK